MPDYNSESFQPAAPIAHVTLRNPESNSEIMNVPMLIDTGADATLIPKVFIERLALRPTNKIFELEGFDKTTSQSAVVVLQLIFEGRMFRGEFLSIDQDYGILGRNILNFLNLQFDGENLTWKVM